MTFLSLQISFHFLEFRGYTIFFLDSVTQHNYFEIH